jgi:hypothetical protein
MRAQSYYARMEDDDYVIALNQAVFQGLTSHQDHGRHSFADGQMAPDIDALSIYHAIIYFDNVYQSPSPQNSDIHLKSMF